MTDILIVDDETNFRKSLAILFRKKGFKVEEAASGGEAMARFHSKFYDLVITDLKMAPVDGLAVLKTAKETSPGTEVIVITAYGSIPAGVEAMRLGAYDFVTKPFDNEELAALLERALEKGRLRQEVRRLKEQIQEKYSFEGIIGNSAPMLEVLKLVAQVCQTDSTVLITGESGTGKELIAKAVHYNSRRKSGPLVTINCGALPENLQESELFGHVKGAFTGAVRDKKGLLVEANNGSAFLDEVGETAFSTQVKLLRFLQDGEIRRVGDNFPIRVDVRLIAATNKNLEEEVKQGRFREDLYYRLSVIPIHLPPLRQRKDDIPLLAEYFLKNFSEKVGKKIHAIAPRTMALLQAYHWPGNIRELENVLERAVIVAPEDTLLPEHLPSRFEGVKDLFAEVVEQGNLSLADVERLYLLNVLKRLGGNRVKAARELGISKATLWRKLKEYGFEESQMVKEPTDEEA